MIKTIKEDLSFTVSLLTSENINEVHDMLRSQLELLSSYKKFIAQKDKLVENDRTFKLKKKYTEEAVVNKVSSLQSRIAPNEKNKSHYLFERKIKGGFVSEISSFVPEGMVRKLELKHGDMVFAEKDKNNIHLNHYHYGVSKRIGINDAPGRKQFNSCPVEKMGDVWIVKKSNETGSLIKLNDVPYTVLINNLDIKEYELQIGDLIDVAFYENNPKYSKVIWKHK